MNFEDHVFVNPKALLAALAKASEADAEALLEGRVKAGITQQLVKDARLTDDVIKAAIALERGRRTDNGNHTNLYYCLTDLLEERNPVPTQIVHEVHFSTGPKTWGTRKEVHIVSPGPRDTGSAIDHLIAWAYIERRSLSRAA